MIIVADDHGPTRRVLSELLASDGWTVLEASDGEELLRLATRHHPTADVTDLSMPRMDGLRAARALRSNEETAELPIVAITAQALTPDRRQALDDVFDRVISKPVRPGELRQGLAGAG
jgi:CheY-like chemotaxis protein